MKKGIKLVLVIFLFHMNYVYADATASISVSTTSTVVGNRGTATLTIHGDEVLGQIYGTFSCEGLGSKDLTYINNTGENATSKSYTIDWTAKSAGNYTCSVSGLEVGSLAHPEKGVYSISATPKKISVIANGGNGSNGNGGSSNHGGVSGGSSGGTVADKEEYSSDNNLGSLTVDGYQISPEFKQDVTEYKLAVDESVEKITIHAKASHEKANVTGSGEVNLSGGENTVEIKVTAENGNEKIYKLIVTVEDQNPIHVKIGKKKYTVVKRNNNLVDLLENYEEVTIKIKNQDVVAYKNSKTKVILVLLKDKDNKIDYYVYDQKRNSYTKYRYISVQGVTLQLIDSTENLKYYTKYTLKIQNQVVDYYKIKENHKVGLIYGTNVKTGNTGFYVYDQNEETLSKYYDEEVKAYQKEIKKMKNYIMIGMGIVAFIVIVIVIISLRNGKKKKKGSTKR